MRTIERTDETVVAAGNEWLLSLLEHTSIRLHGKTITVRVRTAPDHAGQLLLLRAVLTGWLDESAPAADGTHERTVDMGSRGHVVVRLVGATKDLVVEVDVSGVKDPGPKREFFLVSWFKSLFDLHTPFKKVRFDDWKTAGPPAVGWVDDGLRVRFRFESAGPEAVVDPVGYVFSKDVHVDGLRVDLHLVPYVFWAADAEPARDAEGTPYNATVFEHPYRMQADLRHLYEQRCALFVDVDWDDVDPNEAGTTLRGAVDGAVESVEAAAPQDLLFAAFEAFVLGERSLASLAPLLGGGTAGPSPLVSEPSLLRGVDVRPNWARFLYFDEVEDATSFTGRARVVAVRKGRHHGHRNVPEELPPDDVVEVELETEDGERVRILEPNLVRSIQDGTAEVEDVHVVVREGLERAQFRRGPWGRIRSDEVTWLDRVDRSRDLVSIVTLFQRAVEDRDLLQYSGYLRSDPDADPANNLDELPEYDYDWSDPLQRSLYDGTLFFEVPQYRGFAFARDLLPRRWHLPEHDDRGTRLVE